MIIRKAELNDLEQIMNIYKLARKFMAENGNPTQWAGGYPQEDIIRNDILNGNSYVCIENQNIVGTFFFFVGEEPTYRVIEDGNWSYDRPYGTIHRLASNGQVKGIAKACFDYCTSQSDYVRIDTHGDNRFMQSAVQRYGFRKCGKIYVENGSERIAFDYLVG